MLKTAAIFGNGMVLQQNSTVAVFGETDCDYVEIEYDGCSYVANITNGRWLAKISTGEAIKIADGQCVGTQTMIISGKYSSNRPEEVLRIEDIMLGEVWLAGGQSNMELELKDSFNGEQIAMQSDYPNIRFYNVPKCAMVNEELIEAEGNTAWKSVKGEDCKYMSAVAYYFAQRLQQDLNVPIGIIDCYWGGTSATCWVERKTLEDVQKAAGYIKEWDEVIESKSDEQYAREMDDYNKALTDWQDRLEKLRTSNPDVGWVDINEIVGPYPWPVPRGNTSPFRPFGLHKSMVSRVAPYGVKGFIYYQAEEDGERADYYSELNSAVIKQWREDFFIDEDVFDKPFYITQLPMFIANNVEDDKQWCILRQQQDLCARSNSNVGIAVISDCGEFDNIHPLDKKTPGQRLAEQIILGVYGIERKDIGDGSLGLGGLHNCRATKIDINNNICEISFEKTYGGLCYRYSDGEKLTADGTNIMLTDGALLEDSVRGIEVSSDGISYTIPKLSVSGDKLILTSDESISVVRYGWFNYGIANLYSAAGVPVMPFLYEKR